MTMSATANAAPSGMVAPNHSPGRFIVAGYVLIAVTLGVFGTWAAMAPLDSGVLAGGVVSVEGNRKTVQHLEGGIVATIHVREGAIVEANDTLIQLERSQAVGNHAVWDGKRLYLETVAARLAAESLGKSRVEFPTELLDAGNESHRTAMDIQQRLLTDRNAMRDGRVSVLRERIAQSEKSVTGLRRQIAMIDEQIASMATEIERLDRGLKLGVVAKNQHAEIVRSQLEFERRRGQIEAEIAAIDGTVAEANLQIAQIRQEFTERAVTEGAAIQDQLREVTERTRIAAEVLERTTIVAPVRGMVQNLRVHTHGGVVSPAVPLLDIIPLDEDLLVKARIRPIDIDNVIETAAVEVRFSAFSANETPTVFGKIQSLSRDVLLAEGPMQEPYYQALVVIDDASIPDVIKSRIKPGMPVELIIATGERTLVDYLVKPLTDAFHRSMRED